MMNNTNQHSTRSKRPVASKTPPEGQYEARNPRSPWLNAYYDRIRQRTVRLTTAAVDDLVRRRGEVTIPAICELSRNLDPEGKGIGPAAIRGNAQAYAYYREHSRSCQRYHQMRRRVRSHAQGPSDAAGEPAVPHPERIRADRDLARVRQRYLRQSKSALVERILAAEQVLARTREELSRVQFALADMMQAARDR
jgi:hypothetical protein